MLNESEVVGRLVAFVRISSLNSELDSQKEMIARFAGRVSNFIRRWYEDPDRPRWKAEHSDVLRQLLADAAERQFDWVILDKQSRLGTFNHFEFFAYMQKFIEARVRVWSVQEGELTSAEIATTFRQVASSHAEVEDQKNKAGNVARGMYLNAKQFRFNGGPTPYGYDRLCISPEGMERFRLVEDCRVENPDYVKGSKKHEQRRWINHYTVIYPNGHSERLTQLPGKGKHDWYEFAISVRSERVEIVRSIYRMYVEGLSRGEIATHLNQTQADRSFQSYWHTCHVEQILDCPLYGGEYEWKRRSVAAYKTIDKNGAYVDAVWSKADPRSRFKKVAPEERVKADGCREELRIVDQEVINKAKIRLEYERANPKTRKKTRTDSYWLRAWIFCGHCGRPMRGQTVINSKGGKRYEHAYFRCSGYALNKEVGAPTPCVNNRVRREVVELKLADFLDQLGERIHLDLEAANPRISHLLIPMGEKGSALRALREEMMEYVLARMPKDQHALLGVPGGISLAEAYQHYYGAEVQQWQTEIEKIEARIEELALARVGLPKGGVADRKLVNTIQDLESQAIQMRTNLVPLDKRIDAVARQLHEIEESIRAVTSYSQSKRTRQAAEALKKILSKIEVFSSPSASSLREALVWVADRLVFRPLVGEPIESTLEWPKHLIRPEVIARAKAILAEQAVTGKVNLSQIAKQLQAEGYASPSGKPWGRSSLFKPLAAELAALPPEARDPRSRLRHIGPGATDGGLSTQSARVGRESK
jgi:hypothetical protein